MKANQHEQLILDDVNALMGDPEASNEGTVQALENLQAVIGFYLFAARNGDRAIAAPNQRRLS